MLSVGRLEGLPWILFPCPALQDETDLSVSSSRISFFCLKYPAKLINLWQRGPRVENDRAALTNHGSLSTSPMVRSWHGTI